jgi:hypothetical protein
MIIFPVYTTPRNDSQYNIATLVDQLRALVFSTMPTAGRADGEYSLRLVHMCRWKVGDSALGNSLEQFGRILRHHSQRAAPGRARVSAVPPVRTAFQGATLQLSSVQIWVQTKRELSSLRYPDA